MATKLGLTAPQTGTTPDDELIKQWTTRLATAAPTPQSTVMDGGGLGVTNTQSVPQSYGLPSYNYTPTYNTDWTKQYGDILAAQKTGLEAQYGQQVAGLNAQLPQIKQQYDATRNNAYVNAKMNALGNNELLASQGLAGNAYAAPQSGVSETSRIAQSNALRGNINASNLAQVNSERDIANQITSAGFGRDLGIANATAANNQSMLGALQNDQQFNANLGMQNAQFGANYGLNVAQFGEQQRQSDIQNQMAQARMQMDDTQFQQTFGLNKQQYDEQVRQNDIANQMNQQQYGDSQTQQAYQNAMAELSAFGQIVTPTAAAALGYPVGTPMSKVQYKAPTTSSARRTTNTTPTTETTPTDATLWEKVSAWMALNSN